MKDYIMSQHAKVDDVVVSGRSVGKTFANGTVIALKNADFDIKRGVFCIAGWPIWLRQVNAAAFGIGPDPGDIRRGDRSQ